MRYVGKDSVSAGTLYVLVTTWTEGHDKSDTLVFVIELQIGQC